jgi:hypothetical protein
LNSDIRDQDEVVGVVASFTAALHDPRPDHYIELPHSHDGKGASRFVKPTVAVCKWVVKLKKSEIKQEKIGGIIQPKYIREIILKINELQANKKTASTTTKAKDAGN